MAAPVIVHVRLQPLVGEVHALQLLLERLRIGGIGTRDLVRTLSVGKQQMVEIAKALSLSASILVLDEPFEGLDPTSRTSLLELMSRLARERGMTIVLTTHDIDTVPQFADYAYVLAPGGRIALSGTPEELFARPDVLLAGNIEPPILAELFADVTGGSETGEALVLRVTPGAARTRAGARSPACPRSTGGARAACWAIVLAQMKRFWARRSTAGTCRP